MEKTEDELREELARLQGLFDKWTEDLVECTKQIEYYHANISAITEERRKLGLQIVGIKNDILRGSYRSVPRKKSTRFR